MSETQLSIESQRQQSAFSQNFDKISEDISKAIISREISEHRGREKKYNSIARKALKAKNKLFCGAITLALTTITAIALTLYGLVMLALNLLSNNEDHFITLSGEKADIAAGSMAAGGLLAAVISTVIGVFVTKHHMKISREADQALDWVKECQESASKLEVVAEVSSL